MTDVEPEVRDIALRIAAACGDAPFGLNAGRRRPTELDAHRVSSSRTVWPRGPANSSPMFLASNFQVRLGCALYRLGRYREAIATLTRSDRMNQTYRYPYPRAHGLVFLAMCEQRLGRVAEAQQIFAQARTLVERIRRGELAIAFKNRVQLDSFVAEAEALMGAK